MSTRVLEASALDPSSSLLPHRVYYCDATHSWGAFSEATRVTETDLDVIAVIEARAGSALTGPDAVRLMSWVEDLPIDLDGYYYRFTEGHHGVGSPWRVTSCCAAYAGISDGPMYCRSCYETIDIAYDTPARLDGSWQPGDGPVRITLDDPDTT